MDKILFLVLFSFSSVVYSQCDSSTIINKFKKNGKHCPFVSSKVKEIVTTESRWYTLDEKVNKKHEIKIDSVCFFSDSTAIFYYQSGSNSRNKLNPLIDGIFDGEYFCNFQSTLDSDAMFSIYIEYYDENYLIMKVKLKYDRQRKFHKVGNYLLTKSS